MSDIIPSKQVAEQAIAGMAELVRELNELRAFKAGVPWESLRMLSQWPCERPALFADVWIAANAPEQEAGE